MVQTLGCICSTSLDPVVGMVGDKEIERNFYFKRIARNCLHVCNNAEVFNAPL